MKSFYLLLIVIFSCESFAMESVIRKIKKTVEEQKVSPKQAKVADQKKIENKNSNQCTICLEDISNLDSDFNALSFGCHPEHRLHTECMKELIKNTKDSCCTICRSGLPLGTRMKLDIYDELRKVILRNKENPKSAMTQSDILVAIGLAELRANKYSDAEKISLRNAVGKLLNERDDLIWLKNSYETQLKKYETQFIELKKSHEVECADLQKNYKDAIEKKDELFKLYERLKVEYEITKKKYESTKPSKASKSTKTSKGEMFIKGFMAGGFVGVTFSAYVGYIYYVSSSNPVKN